MFQETPLAPWRWGKDGKIIEQRDLPEHWQKSELRWLELSNEMEIEQDFKLLKHCGLRSSELDSMPLVDILYLLWRIDGEIEIETKRFEAIMEQIRRSAGKK